jgi:divalent metal cation (Fe/Co/Zn/Cd) transporter
LESRYYKRVLLLAIFTIVYNLAEGVISIILGVQDETLALFGFGVDSFIEVISGLGILQMVIRIGKNPGSSRTPFEITALRITGSSFFILTAGLLAGAAINLLSGHKPESTFWGVVISGISILVMFWLYRSKIHYGKKLNSEPVIADGKCTLVCLYMSVVLLFSSVIYELTGFGWVDTIGALGLAWFSFNEGREAFEKARGKENCCEEKA